MCGIAGFFGEGDRDDIERMTRSIAHRGPDGDGYFCDDTLRLYLGHRRLAIRDIAGGHQPMWNEDGSVCIVYNGELYNHESLRAELVACGHRFRSATSDIEVLVHGFEEWGTELPQRLNGMFAFAIFDRNRQTLFLARDRFGEKPLYYRFDGKNLWFGSELRALLSHRQFCARVSLPSLQKFFAYGYFPTPHTLYEGVKKLPGGSWLSFDLRTATLREGRYWQFRLQPDESLTEKDEPRLVEELQSLLTKAVAGRLVSDVPLGVFLSGGIDSSAALAVMAKLRDPRGIHSFTIGFREPSFDESPFARQMAQAVGSDHHEQILGIDEVRQVLLPLLGRLDEPLGDASILPTHLLSAFTRKHVTVALSGDGGDELFAGYDPFLALPFAGLYAALMPRPGHAALRQLSSHLPISLGNMGIDFRIRRFLTGLSYPQSMWNPAWMSPVEPAWLKDLFAKPLLPEDVYSEAIALWNRDPKLSVTDRALEFFTTFYLQDDILHKVDRASMLTSLETRAIFLDNGIVDFCQRLPSHFKIRRGQRKHLLKKALTGLLPKDILQRKKKGFGIPLAAWLRQMDAPELPPKLRSIDGLRADFVAQRFVAHQKGQEDNRLLLWCWLSLLAVLSPHGDGSSAS